MDSKKFGAFIQSLRKEKGWTQAELAQRLYVTDKAVSKWERGAGFPDIKLLEPLAEALGVSVLELMRSERTPQQTVSLGDAGEAVANALDVAEIQRKLEHRNLLIACISVAMAVLLVFLIDNMTWLGFFFVCVPMIGLGVGVLLLGVGIHRKRQGLAARAFWGAGLLALMLPVSMLALLWLAPVLGGPVPN